MAIDFQALIDMANLSEEHGVVMKDWLVEEIQGGVKDVKCGTVGCLLGTWAYHNLDRTAATTYTHLAWQLNWGTGGARRLAEDELGLSWNQYAWLFTEGLVGVPREISKIRWRDLSQVSTQEAVARLRKFIYYKLKKQELEEAWIEENRCHRKHAQCENQATVSQVEKADLTKELSVIV